MPKQPHETILLAWNPKQYPWGNLQDELAEVRRKGKATDSWSVGNRKNLESGTRFFMIRLGAEPRGIVGSGWTTEIPQEAPHWKLDRAAKGETAWYADIFFDVLEETPLIPISELKDSSWGTSMHWSTQMSGIEIPPEVATPLEETWSSRVGAKPFGGIEEISSPTPVTRKHVSRVYVNRYERDPKARALCLARYGTTCQVCGKLLEQVYGPAAKDVIHVHHRTPISEIPVGAQIDPIKDLVPVCPNCHAVIHSRAEPYSPEEVREMIRASR